MPPRYPFPWSTLLRLGYGILRQRPVSFRDEALHCTHQLRPANGTGIAFFALGQENIPTDGPCLITTNHYTHPGFQSWWLTLSISALVPVDIHWVISGGWNFAGRQVSQITQAIFPRVAQAYGFTTMPPMPPNPAETVQRAAAVRQVLTYVQKTPRPVVGLAPEGHHQEKGILRHPFPGTGRFMLQLAKQGLKIVPCGIYETPQALVVQFGPHYHLSVPHELSPDERDRQASQVVMSAIARLLPEPQRGEFG